MELVIGILGVLVGAGLSWAIAHNYYRLTLKTDPAPAIKELDDKITELRIELKDDKIPKADLEKTLEQIQNKYRLVIENYSDYLQVLVSTIDLVLVDIKEQKYEKLQDDVPKIYERLQEVIRRAKKQSEVKLYN